jgi:hypothetical protein
MKVKFLTGPRAGQIDHAENSQATDLLVKAGIIEVVPYKDFRERLAADMAARPKPATTIGWGVQNTLKAVLIHKTVTCGERVDTFTYSEPPADCPPSIVARFNKESAVGAQMRQDQEHAQKVKQANENVVPGKSSRIMSAINAWRGESK